MNKGQLIDAIAAKTGCSKKDTIAVLDAFRETVVNTLQHGDKVSWVGFGNFEVKRRAARTGRNPANGETVNIPAKNAPVFKAGKAFKDELN